MSRRHVVLLVTAALVVAGCTTVSLPRVAPAPGPTGTGPAEPAPGPRLVHGQPDRDGRGYYADPSVYLSAAELVELRGVAGIPVLVPTWLPAWTVDAEFLSSGKTPGYDFWWSLDDPAVTDFGLRHEVEVPSTIQLSFHTWIYGPNVTRRFNDDVVSEVRGYGYTPSNLHDEGPPTGPDCYPNEAALGWDTADLTGYFVAYLIPNPECSNGYFERDDMVKFADSFVPIDLVGQTDVLLPEPLWSLFVEPTPSPSPTPPPPSTSPTPSPSPSPSTSPTPSPSPSPSPSAAPSPATSPSPSPSTSPSPVPTNSASPTATSHPTPSPSPSPTQTASQRSTSGHLRS